MTPTDTLPDARLSADPALPVVVEPRSARIDPVEWATAHR